MSWRVKFVLRTTLIVLAGLALSCAAAFLLAPKLFLPPLPPPPRIDAPRGEPPSRRVAFEERIRTGAGDYAVGAGFLLELPNGDAIGVTTAHSVGKDNFPPLAFVDVDSGGAVATFDELVAPLGSPITSRDDLTGDYILMKPTVPPDPAIVLQPDPRGAPQPGERVLLYNGRASQDVIPGTVESIGPGGVWVRMDYFFIPGGMSGSPVISAHTGKVVGMIIAASPRIGAIIIGLNPIGVIVDKATSR
jgi:hypothetical protein